MELLQKKAELQNRILGGDFSCLEELKEVLIKLEEPKKMPEPQPEAPSEPQPEPSKPNPAKKR